LSLIFCCGLSVGFNLGLSAHCVCDADSNFRTDQQALGAYDAGFLSRFNDQNGEAGTGDSLNERGLDDTDFDGYRNEDDIDNFGDDGLGQKYDDFSDNWRHINDEPEKKKEPPKLNLSMWLNETIAPLYARSLQAWPYVTAFLTELSRLKLPFFLYGGSLLGAMRNGQQPVYHGDFDLFMAPWSIRGLIRSSAPRHPNVTNMSCPDEAGHVVYVHNITVDSRIVRFVVAVTMSKIFHVWAYDERWRGPIKVTDVFTCVSDGWAKPDLDVFSPDLNRTLFRISDIAIDGLNVPKQAIPVVIPEHTTRLQTFLASVYGENFRTPHAPLNYQQNGGVVTENVDKWVPIEAEFGSYEKFVANISKVPIFTEAVKREFQRTASYGTYDCQDDRHTAEAVGEISMLYELDTYVVDLLSTPRNIPTPSPPQETDRSDSVWGFNDWSWNLNTRYERCWMRVPF